MNGPTAHDTMDETTNKPCIQTANIICKQTSEGNITVVIHPPPPLPASSRRLSRSEPVSARPAPQKTRRASVAAVTAIKEKETKAMHENKGKDGQQDDEANQGKDKSMQDITDNKESSRDIPCISPPFTPEPNDSSHFLSDMTSQSYTGDMNHQQQLQQQHDTIQASLQGKS